MKFDINKIINEYLSQEDIASIEVDNMPFMEFENLENVDEIIIPSQLELSKIIEKNKNFTKIMLNIRKNVIKDLAENISYDIKDNIEQIKCQAQEAERTKAEELEQQELAILEKVLSKQLNSAQKKLLNDYYGLKI